MNNEIIKKFSPLIDNVFFGSCLLDKEREFLKKCIEDKIV